MPPSTMRATTPDRPTETWVYDTLYRQPSSWSSAEAIGLFALGVLEDGEFMQSRESRETKIRSQMRLSMRSFSQISVHLCNP